MRCKRFIAVAVASYGESGGLLIPAGYHVLSVVDGYSAIVGKDKVG